MQNPTHPYSNHFQEHYWSGGASEKDYVFLQANHLPQRFANTAHFTVAELGFGTGLNFLLTAHLWYTTAPPTATLTYISYEQFPLTPEQLQAIHNHLPPELHNPTFLTIYNPAQGWNTYTLGPITLHLYKGDATLGLPTQPEPAHAWFLDGFSPAKNPQLWSPEICTLIAAHSHPHATASTYSVARMVRDNLTAAGFKVEKKGGHPPKKDMLTAQLT